MVKEITSFEEYIKAIDYELTIGELEEAKILRSSVNDRKVSKTFIIKL